MRSIRASLAIVVLAAAIFPSPALAGSGGTGLPPPPPPTVHGGKAKLEGGLAVAPKHAPQRIKDAIAAANAISRAHPYCLGGGHKAWASSCYDCSGAVSFALHGGGMLDSPLVSGDLARWGAAGKGRWVTVYANKRHTFMMIAGLRFDTADTAGGGPGWAGSMGAYEASQHYAIRQPG